MKIKEVTVTTEKWWKHQNNSEKPVVKVWQRQLREEREREERLFGLLRKTHISFNELCQLRLETIRSVELIITFAEMYIKATHNRADLCVFSKSKKTTNPVCF